MPRLLKEGALGGHMPHLYENPYLTFKKLKDVLTKASEGHLEGTEKTDGQNLFISYSVKDGQAKAARNKGNIKDGGLTAKGLAKKFGGRGSLEVAFTEAFNSFEKAINVLTDEEKIEIFGKDADIFYNAEIQDPRNANVINYDFKTLNIHRVGHAKFDKETGKTEEVDTADNAAKLENALEKMKDHLEHDGFRIQMNAIRRLEALSTDEALSNALSKLESVISSAGISDDQTIGDYLTAKIVPMIKADFPSAPEDRMEMLMNRLFHGTDIKIKEIQAGLDKEQKKAISAAVKKLGDYFKEVIAPIEDIIHDFSVEILKAFHSAFILDNEKEVKRLRKEVAAAIKGIEASGREDAMEILTKQLSKLKKAENVSSASEGFVFDYDGKTYKFTGNFAPANQLLGLFKYGRGKIPALSKLNEATEEEKKLLVLLPGGYKPPTKGHYEMIKYYNDQPSVGKVLVLIGPGERDNIGRDASVKVFNLYGLHDLDKVSVEETEYNSPMRAAYEFLISDPRREEYKDLIFSVGASDKLDKKGVPDFERAKIFVEYYKNNPDKLPEGFETGEPPCCPAVGGEVPLSATNLRKAIANDDTESIKQLIPDHIDAEELVNIVKGNVEESSSMAGGDVAGYAGEEGKRDEDEELEEQKIRKLVRRGLMIIMENKTKENKLRELVNKIIKEKYNNKVLKEQDEENMAKGTHSTAINYLNKVLKSIIPGKSGGSQLEPEYTDLDRPEYRQSFIKHVIQGLYDELAPKMSLSGLLARFETRRQQFSQKEELALQEAEDLTLKLDDDGLPAVGEDKEEISSMPTGEVTEKGKEGDFPEEGTLKGENTIGRKAAYRFIKGQLDAIVGALNDLEETPEEREEREQQEPDSQDPQEEYLDYLFTNLILHAYRLENKHFNSSFEESEKFFKDVIDRADHEREEAEEAMVGHEEEGGGEEEDLGLELETPPEEEEELELAL